MNSFLAHWREAATLILAAGIKRTAAAESLKTGGVPKNASNPKVNRSDTSCQFDYEVLLLQRSSKSGFMPNAHVFPGGLVDAADFSSEWLDLFQDVRHSPNFALGRVKQPPSTRPPIFATDRMKLGSPVPGEVAFRICAIRETFEESGVLLVVPKQAFNGFNTTQHKSAGGQNTGELTALAGLLEEKELMHWRLSVIENPCNFIRMCRELECLPNIWALYEWGNWLTPVGRKEKQRRYDTAFFICCLEEKPHTVQDEKEIVTFKWSSPLETILSFQAREIWIAPPQFYEMCRMYRFPLLHDLHSFACLRSLEGCEQWLPVQLSSSEGFISLLPGDSLYPKNVDLFRESDVSVTTEKSLEELQKAKTSIHRMVLHDPYTVSIHINITPKYRHLAPHAAPFDIDSHL
ncbi:acyl-coenzyme A diphosphatase NUDT19 [Denticeps clupeoides]|uniref:Acyl-coenzyme A diphosphatase NUDT19 n=1 Tax=Denticeps clupeoides TaxID=299321 RepID=A0AAY4DPR2_9TELE|nr:nucleoside diphosphate-linked moiety X motif 19 [Denticeps clupeoides]